MKSGTPKTHPKKQRKKYAFLTPLTFQIEVPVQARARFSQNQRLQKCIPKTSPNASQNRWKIIKIRVKMRYKKVYRKIIEKSAQKWPQGLPKPSPNLPKILPKCSQSPQLGPKMVPRGSQDALNLDFKGFLVHFWWIFDAFLDTFSMTYSLKMSRKNGPRHHTLGAALSGFAFLHFSHAFLNLSYQVEFKAQTRSDASWAYKFL